MFIYLFPFIVAAMDLGAFFVYAWEGKWAFALTWLFYALSAVTLGIAGGE
jgi:hypothetical protein